MLIIGPTPFPPTSFAYILKFLIVFLVLKSDFYLIINAFLHGYVVLRIVERRNKIWGKKIMKPHGIMRGTLILEIEY